MHPSTIARYAPAESATPQGPLAATTSLDQTVTEAGFYKFVTYSTGLYYAVSNATIAGYPAYNSGNYMIAGHEYCYYLEPGDHFRTNSSSVLVQRFA